jgi:putative zinc finger/helix-turn-helix YgiT family protein
VELRVVIVVDIRKCVVCGSRDVFETDEPVSVQIKGTGLDVPGIPHMKCRSCGEEYFDAGATTLLQRKATSRYKADNDLLTGDEIKAIRKKYGMTQSDLERFLGVATNTVVRWERDTVFQSRPVDKLLRLVRDHPELIDYFQGDSEDTLQLASV